MLRAKGYKGIVYVASHDMDALWREDGMAYHTLVVSPAAEPHKTLVSQLRAACQFIDKHVPALVCSPCPKLRATVAAAAMISSGEESSVDSVLETLYDRGVITEQLADEEIKELREFAAGISSGQPTTPKLEATTVPLGSMSPLKRAAPPPSTHAGGEASGPLAKAHKSSGDDQRDLLVPAQRELSNEAL